MATGRSPTSSAEDRHRAAHGRGHDPANGASGVSSGVSPTVTFSEAMDPASLTTSTFTLTKQQSIRFPLVSYQSQVATLDPNASLEANTSYTAKVKGGTGGAKDVAGNVLAADVSWSFTTAEATNRPPSPVIDTPASTLTWKVGDAVAFTGHASDPEQGRSRPPRSRGASLQHCPSNCHAHTIQSWPGVAGGSFSAPDHEYPSYLELELTAVDAGGLSATATLRLDPQTVALSFTTSPSGLSLGRRHIAGDALRPHGHRRLDELVEAPTPQTLNGTISSRRGRTETPDPQRRRLRRRRPSPPTT